jgi:hypothetical protein
MMNNYLQVALQLRELVPDDRGWVLDQLPQHASGTLRSILDRLERGDTTEGAESHGMAVAVDTAMPASASNDQQARVLMEEASQDAERLLDDASVDEVSAELAGAPDWLVAAVLSVRDWSWSEDWLLTQDQARRHAIYEIVRAARELQPRAGEALVEILASRLAPPAQQSVRSSKLESTLRRMLRRNESAA